MQNLLNLSINANIQISFSANLIKQFFVMAFSVFYYRCQYHHFLISKLLTYQLDNLLIRIMHHLFTRLIRIGYARTRKEQTEIIIYFRNSAHCTARISAGCLLVNGYNRRKTRYFVHIRALHTPQIAASIRTEGVDITSLSLSKNGIKRQTGFSASTHARNHRQFITRNTHVHIFEIVDASTCYGYPLLIRIFF